MTPLPLRVALLVLCVLTAGAPRVGAEYRAIETRDLRLVYPHPVLSFIAPYTARCFENSMAVHRRLWDYAPGEKVNVILDDFTDYGNAGVWVNPRNSMVVHIAPASFVYETGPSNERMNFTMNHEVVHVLALDQPAGADHLFRRFFRGKVRETSEHPESILYSHLTVPRRAAPRWYHEGVAVFMETWMAGGLGRAQGPYDEMVFRAMVRDGAHFYDPLGLESEGTRVDFQVGVNSYLYGTRFMTWLAYTEGPEKVLAWVGRRPGSRRYFASQFEHVFGRSLSEAWAAWIADEHVFQRANLDSIRRHPTTGFRDLSPLALGSVSRAFVDRTSASLIAAVYHPGRVAHLAAIPLAGGAPRVLHEIKGPALYFVSSLAFDADARTVFFTTDNNEWRDLRTYDLASGRVENLITDARLGDLAFDPASRDLWAMRHFNGISSLVRLAPPYREWRLVWALPYGLDLYDLDVSPDGRRLAASMAEISGRQTLRLFELDALARGDTTSRTLWDFGSAVPANFVFEPSGRALVGSSYYTGVSNVFRYDLDADSMHIVSNAETGFFRPIPTGEDSLLVFRYSGHGFTPARIRPRSLDAVGAVTFLGERLADRHPVVRSWIAPPPSSVTLDPSATPTPYRPLTRLGLAAAYPIVEGYRDRTAFGWRAEISDPLAFHQISLAATWSPQDGLPEDERLHLAARYRRYDLELAFRLNPASFYDLVGPRKSSRRGFGTTASWHRLLVRDVPRQLELAANASHWGGLRRLPENQNVEVSQGFDQLLSGGVELRYRNLRSSIGAPDHERGHAWWLGGSVNGVRFEDATGSRWKGFPFVDGGLDAGHPLPFLRHSSVWLRTAAGWSPGDRDEPFANFFFGGFGNNWLDRAEPKRYREPYQFPGAEIDAVAGTEFARAMVDWNLPALRFRRAGTLALYASWARLSLFSGALVANPGDVPSRRTLGHAGGQVDVRFQLLTQSPLTLSFGYARAFERDRATTDEWMASLKVL